MTAVYDLSKIGPTEFENLVNFLALKTLGLGLSSFGPGADGGRDGYFEGEAPYPSVVNKWGGVWYVQSKFHAPHLSTNPQKWLVAQVAAEIKAFDEEPTDRKWPDNWIIATNIDPGGKPETGSFDAICKLVGKSTVGKKINVHVWGGRKILDLLAQHPDAAKYYAHFLTPGHLITQLYDQLADANTSVEEIVRFFLVTQFADNLFTKLDQAGSSADVRPGVHDLFIDLPFTINAARQETYVLRALSRAAAQCHKYSIRQQYPEKWDAWNKKAQRARVSLIKGGPGQGKSTIGQYLCQIHRAVQILSSDKIPVVQSLRNAATSIRESAARDGFVPVSPRIPVQIELKDFAHWYSQRGAQQSKTVLSYIADTIAKKTGSAVLAKTIKRALSHATWLAVFDGLDEVPNDFKDAVSNEIIAFLNDVLIEIDADVLAICTSRPQGYSGQFSGLEGPVIELSLLSVKAAMRCARPVLVFGRSAEEAAKSIQTLETAIRSPNVKELMTTPLQSHIMAVVVRDGGRPPERRWQLFNSFYLVMKKRESLKDFADQRIASLLREQDRLLKSVHMRLGFVLHARAERSEGAQTHLSRAEFRHLVRDVVCQLVDRDIDNTVNGVMEATTERLVLVSTPESGEHVRFDIRQLQEFFAAEFLYAGVDSRELSSRIEIIGGDAHWREVVHFVLSALIENQRSADLAMSVQVLRKLNEGEEGDRARLFHRRMARAALLAMRLLVEGVLEQDQRDRQQIRPLLEPIAGIFDVASLRSLCRLAPPMSRQWVIDLFLDRVATVVARESVGALYVLGWLLTDTTASAPAAISFANAPRALQEILLDLWQPARELAFHQDLLVEDEPVEPLAQWVVNLVITLLNDSSWVGFTINGVRSMLNICRHTPRPALELAFGTCGIKPKATKIALDCIGLFESDNRRSRSRKGGPDVDCGILNGQLFSENWRSDSLPECLKVDRACELVSQATGLTKLLLTATWWCQDRSDAALKALVDEVDVAGDKIACLPPAFLALLPIAGPHALKPFCTDHLRICTAADVRVMAARPLHEGISMFYANLSVKTAKPATPEDWRRLAVTLPQVAVSIALSPDQFHLVGDPVFVPELQALIEGAPTLAAQSILGWGILKEKAPTLLENLKSCVKQLPSTNCDFQNTFPIRDIVPFELDLPADLPLLPLVAQAFIELNTNSDRHIYRRHFRDSSSFSADALLKSYALDKSCLKGIYDDSSNPQDVRASAIALEWLVESEGESQRGLVPDWTAVGHAFDSYKALRNECNQDWLTKALVHGVLKSLPESQRSVAIFVTDLMELCTDGSGPREELVELIQIWRERSSAPVHAKQAMEKWLGYHFEAPSYLSG